jgi:hypothetical protein
MWITGGVTEPGGECRGVRSHRDDRGCVTGLKCKVWGCTVSSVEVHTRKDRKKSAPRSKNQVDQTDEEYALFEAFMQACPDFGGEAITNWVPTGSSHDPPDIICTTVSEKHVGVEICQWAHESAMKSGRLRDRINNEILTAIGPQPLNKSQHFWLVVFHPKNKSHLSPNQHGLFRRAFFDLIDYIDREWSAPKHRGHAYDFRDVKNFTPLDKYLEFVTFRPPDAALSAAVEKAIIASGGNAMLSETDGEQVDWIVPAVQAQWVRTCYDKDQWEPDSHGNTTVEAALLNLLIKKADKCGEGQLKTACSELHLLIALHDAIAYYPPMPQIYSTAKRAVDRARNGRPWPFGRTFFLIGDENPTVRRLC